MSVESLTPRERNTLFASYFTSVGIFIGWVTCSLFWLFMGWLPS